MTKQAVHEAHRASNTAVLRGQVVGEVTRRTLSDGTERVGFSLASPAGDHTVGSARWSVPVVLEGADTKLVDLLTTPASADRGGSIEVLVVGHVRRRFFRAGGTTAARTEVVARQVVPVRRRRQVERLLDEVQRSLGAN